MTEMVGRDGAAARLRTGLLLLVAVGVVGAILALAYDRHWLSPWQFAPWVTLGIVIVATSALAVRQTALTVRLARVVAVVTIVSALLGVWQHISANLDAGSNGHDHAAHRESTTTSDQAPDHHEETQGDGHHHDDEGSEGDGHHHDEEKSEGDGHHHGEEGSEGDGHHHHDQESSSGEANESTDEEGTSVSPSFLDVVIGAVGHAPIPAALSLAPIGLALGLATVGLGGSRPELQQ